MRVRICKITNFSLSWVLLPWCIETDTKEGTLKAQVPILGNFDILNLFSWADKVEFPGMWRFKVGVWDNFISFRLQVNYMKTLNVHIGGCTLITSSFLRLLWTPPSPLKFMWSQIMDHVYNILPLYILLNWPSNTN